MKTESTINNFLVKARSEVKQNTLTKIIYWVHKHPTVIKTAEVVGGALGIASIVNLAVSPRIVTAFAAFGGGIIGLISIVAYKFLDIAIPPNHDMSHHVFKPASCDGGRLYYQGDIPILELNYDDHDEAGIAHGYLMGEYIEILLNRLNFLKKFGFFPAVEKIPNVLKAIRKTIPEEYLMEMQGIVDGFNQWSFDGRGANAKTIQFNDLLFFHLMADSIHFIPEEIEQKIKSKDVRKNPDKNRKALFGCTAVIHRDAKKGIVFGRNMDWPSFGVFGSYSLIINRKHKDEKLSTVEVGLPGFVGTLTGMNSNGLSLAMNVCSGNTEKIEGMPAVFFNRKCLEKCRDVSEVIKEVDQQSPLGSYHLIVADHEIAKSLHFYQGKKKAHVVREFNEKDPLITTNCNYLSKTSQCNDMHFSQKRNAIIEKLFEEVKASKAKIVKGSLLLPYVNNFLTTHKVIMKPASKKMKIAFNNAFAGETNLHKLDTQTLF